MLFRPSFKKAATAPAFALRVLALLALLQFAAPGGTLWLCENAICGVTACCCEQPTDPNSCVTSAEHAEGNHYGAGVSSGFTASSAGGDCHCNALTPPAAVRTNSHLSVLPPVAVIVPAQFAVESPLLSRVDRPREARGPPPRQLWLALASPRGPPLS